MDWSAHYPVYFNAPSAPGQGSTAGPAGKQVEFADVGCGFGGLSVALAPLFPDTLMLGTQPAQCLPVPVRDMWCDLFS